MDTVFLTLTLVIEQERFGWNKRKGEQEFTIEIPLEIINSIDISSLSQVLLPMALSKYTEWKPKNE